MSKSKIVTSVVSCISVDQLNTCYSWVADLCRRGFLTQKEEDTLLRLMNNQYKLLIRRRNERAQKSYSTL